MGMGATVLMATDPVATNPALNDTHLQKLQSWLQQRRMNTLITGISLMKAMKDTHLRPRRG